MITPESLLRAVDKRRVALGAERGAPRPVTYLEIADELGFHSSLFSRIQAGTLPGEERLAAILDWLGDEELAHCSECEEATELEAEEPVEEPEPTEELDAEAEMVDNDADLPTINAIYAKGGLSNSDDEDTQKAVARVRELLAEGAVGVSVSLDVYPEDMKVIAEAEEQAAKQSDETGEWVDPKEFLPEGFVMRQRVRHVAIVDTPAFADARLTENEDGSLEGEVVYEGLYTGDGRTIQLDSIEIRDTKLPVAIIWDRTDGDHSGMTVGFITELDRREASITSARTVLDDEVINASVEPMQLPASYFEKATPTKAEPVRISKADANGYRRIYGLAAPNGVCLRQNTTCWTWPGDKDKTHKHFHTGTLLGLDNGQSVRVGALTIGGAHLDGALAKQGVSARDASNHRDNANRVFGLVRVWESRFGLMMTGVVPPDVTEADVARALACSPSIEFWPDNGGRTLIGLHLVPTPALPVLASTGSAEHYVTDFSIELEEDMETEEEVSVATEIEGIDELIRGFEAMTEKLESMEKSLKTLLALTPIDDIVIE